MTQTCIDGSSYSPIGRVRCADCSNSERKDDRLICKVKHIDCKSRNDPAVCTHFKQRGPGVYCIRLTATAVQTVKADNETEAKEMADWCDADMCGFDIVSVEKVN